MGHAIIIFLAGLFCLFATSDEEKQRLIEEEKEAFIREHEII